MTIQIDSLQSVFAFILSAVVVLGLVATLHWKIFAAPLLQKLLDPTNARINITSRVVREKFPAEYTRIEGEYNQELKLRSSL